MFDFYTIDEIEGKKGQVYIKPSFLITHSSDLMIRGRDFYAYWDEATGLWSKDEDGLFDIIDADIAKYRKRIQEDETRKVVPIAKYIKRASSGVIDEWHKYCQKQMRDSYKELDSKIIFRSTVTTKKDYASKKLPYDLVDGECPAWDEIVGTLYFPEEREKIEWSIGAIISGDSKKIQKFIVFYGEGGTGKSTIMGIIEKLFDGYWSRFNSKEITSGSNQFALESFKNNPLVSIEHDGDLSRIEDNTILNSIVSHESMEVNEKFKSKYLMNFNTFLYLGTNKPVKITDAKSGVIRRLIDVRPTGKKISRKRYDTLIEQVDFELGQIASHCLNVYKKLGKSYYDNYIPKDMIASTNEFYNFVEEYYDMFLKENGVSAKKAYSLYKQYCTDVNVPYQLSYTKFRVEFATYFDEVKNRVKIKGQEYFNYYLGFKWNKFPGHDGPKESVKALKDENAESSENGPYGIKQDNDGNWIIFKDYSEFERGSFLNWSCGDCIAQYAKADGTPKDYWSKVKTHLSDLDWRELHYVLLPENHIVIDFDLRGPDGEKDLKLNLEAAKKFPKTYAETSKSGKGIHLHYIYDGDVSKLSHIYDEGIEIKTFGGKAALRRKLSLCNDLEISHINSGLPLKGVKNTVIDMDSVNLGKALETTIKKCLMKEVHQDTTSNVDFIKKILDDAYISGKSYSVDPALRQKVLNFAINSTHQSEKCVRTVGQMKWESAKEITDFNFKKGDDEPIIFFDWEVFPNFCCMCWKVHHVDGVHKLINPTSEELEPFVGRKLVGHNCKDYDNNIFYARWAKGYSNRQLFELSQGLINSEDNNMKRQYKFKEAVGLSYTDTLDFAATKLGLKKWEIKLGLYHLENEHAWDKDLDEKYWDEVSDYCCNDVIATEAVFDHLEEDFKARCLLADLSNLLTGSGTVNDSTNQLTTKIILRGDRNANKQFVYPDLAAEFPGYEYNSFGIDKSRYNAGTKIVKGKSLYLGEDPGEGGYVWAKPGMYWNVVTFDVASMHPSSIIAENGFGKYTDNFKQLLDIRLHIKHKEYDEVKKMFNGVFAKYLTATDPEELKKQAKALSYALKIAINSVYGLTSAGFDNDLRDPRNKDNWVAKRGALMMMTLKRDVINMGGEVIHCKTDSIKVVNPSEEIANYIYAFGKKYGYTFEIEAKYDRICLVNESAYIAKESDWEGNEEPGKWSGTGTQFKDKTNPYVFKTLFSKEPIIFDDMCETKSVTTAIYLDFNEDLPDVSELEKERDKLLKKIRDDAEPLADDLKALENYDKEIARGHNYKFVGKVGVFTPMVDGCGAGRLVAKRGDKYSAVSDTKQTRWFESGRVGELGLEDKINKDYYREKCDEAIDDISKFGDFDEFVNGPSKPLFVNELPPDFMNIPEGVGENEGMPY